MITLGPIGLTDIESSQTVCVWDLSNDMNHTDNSLCPTLDKTIYEKREECVIEASQTCSPTAQQRHKHSSMDGDKLMHSSKSGFATDQSRSNAIE